MSGCYHGNIEDHVRFDHVPDGSLICKRRLLSFIGGLKGPRKNPVTTAQIKKRFARQDWDFVNNCLFDLIGEKKISVFNRSLSSGRRYNGVCVYQVKETEQ